MTDSRPTAVDGTTAPLARACGSRQWAHLLRDLSLARKLLVILMATSVGALLLAGAAITAREISTTRTAMEHDLTSLGDVVAGNCAAALSFQDPDAANEALASLAARHEIARAALVLPDHAIFSSFVRRGEAPLVSVARPLTPGLMQIGGRLTIVRPVVSRGEQLGVLYLECTMQALQARIRDVVGSVLVLVLLAALFAYAVSLRLHRVVSEPITRLSRAAREVSASRDYSVRVEWPSQDELGALTESFNGMMAQIQAQEQALLSSHELLRQAQKMEAVGQLAGGVAHDFNNLLTAINGYTTLLERRTDPDDPRQGSIREIRRAGERAAELVRQLLAFGRKQALEPRVLDLREALADVENMLGRLIPADIQLVWATHAGTAAVKADPGQIQQAVVNLVVNARDAMPAGGTITIETSRADLDKAYVREHPEARMGRHVVLSVRDSGSGIPVEVRPHLFEPFFTTKAVGQGTGLGLATVHGIVNQSGGHVTFETELGVGTTFRIYLPAVAEAAAGEDRPHTEAAAGGCETILLVEDEPMVRELARDILELHGYHVLDCGGPHEAIAVTASHAGSIQLLLTDVIMPGMNGRDLSRRLAALRPGLRTLFMSGYTDGLLCDQGASGPDSAFIQKPFAADALAARVRAMLDQQRISRAA